MASESSTSARDAYDAAEAVKSTLVSLADLCAKGTSHYARRQYGEAADYYARASELQAGLKGEMDPENAEVLFLYGRSLFRVGQGKSDVLGGRAQGGRERKKAEGVVGERVEGVVVTEGVKEEGEEGKEVKKPLFQFTGDENFEESEDEEEGEGEEEEEEDELATAFEVLDLARVLFTRKLESPESGDADGNGKGKEVGDSATTKHIKERLADTHDLLAEISLENERFPSAVADFRASLGYKKELYGQESEVIAEAHYKLSLALEFASITTTAEAGEGEGEGEGKGEAQVDEGMREEAARELESAIESTRMKLQAKEVELAEMASPEENDETRKQIAEVREILADMEQRVSRSESLSLPSRIIPHCRLWVHRR